MCVRFPYFSLFFIFNLSVFSLMLLMPLFCCFLLFFHSFFLRRILFHYAFVVVVVMALSLRLDDCITFFFVLAFCCCCCWYHFLSPTASLKCMFVFIWRVIQYSRVIKINKLKTNNRSTSTAKQNLFPTKMQWCVCVCVCGV